jgi:hypothetical protein
VIRWPLGMPEMLVTSVGLWLMTGPRRSTGTGPAGQVPARMQSRGLGGTGWCPVPQVMVHTPVVGPEPQFQPYFTLFNLFWLGPFFLSFFEAWRSRSVP